MRYKICSIKKQEFFVDFFLFKIRLSYLKNNDGAWFMVDSKQRSQGRGRWSKPRENQNSTFRGFSTLAVICINYHFC